MLYPIGAKMRIIHATAYSKQYHCERVDAHIIVLITYARPFTIGLGDTNSTRMNPSTNRRRIHMTKETSSHISFTVFTLISIFKDVLNPYPKTTDPRYILSPTYRIPLFNFVLNYEVYFQ